MKKPIILFLLLMCFFTANVAFAQNSLRYDEETEAFVETMVQTLGDDFIQGRTFMRHADEVIFDQNCAVFALGTDTPEKFTAEEWIAVSPDYQIFRLDIIQNTWDAYHPTNYTEDNADSPDYSAYTSLVKSYENNWGTLSYKKVDEYSELYDVWGVSFIDLVDLNHDGICELVLVRMDEETAVSGTSTSPMSRSGKVLQVFTLKDGQSVEKIGDFPLIADFLSPSVKLASVNNKVYLVTGDRSDVVWHEDFWEFTGTGFNKVKSFATMMPISPNGTYGDVQFQIDGHSVDTATFNAVYREKWASNMQTSVLTNILSENIQTLVNHMAKAKKKLAELSANTAFAQPEKTFAVKFMGYTADWLGMPDISPYFTDEELFSLNHQDFGGSEMYLVKNNRHGRTYVYENIIDENGQAQVGRRLYESKAGEVLFFTCNESETRPNIVLLYVSPEREEFYFRPSLSMMDGSVELGKNAEALKVKN